MCSGWVERTTGMNDEEVVRVLAEREGWTTVDCWCGCGAKQMSRDGKRAWPGKLPTNYLTSRDALQPVMEKLTQDEWRRLSWRIVPVASARGIARRLLSIPPRDLANAIAEAMDGTL